MPTAAYRLFAEGDDDLLSMALSQLPPQLLITASAVCWRWARLAEPQMRELCQGMAYALPRRPRLQRGAAAASPLAELQWRSLFVTRACRACFTAKGDFAVRRESIGAPVLFLCGGCCKREPVVARLQRGRLTLDVTGLSGKPLFTKKASRFCADVSHYATR